MPSNHGAKYPVVDPDPSVTKAVWNFNLKDVSSIGGITGVAFVTGWFGSSKPIRGPNSRFMGLIGLLGGLTYATMRSTQRLTGLEPNDSEVKKYGSLTPAQLQLRAEKMGQANLSLIDSSYDEPKASP